MRMCYFRVDMCYCLRYSSSDVSAGSVVDLFDLQVLSMFQTIFHAEAASGQQIHGGMQA